MIKNVTINYVKAKEVEEMGMKNRKNWISWGFIIKCMEASEV